MKKASVLQVIFYALQYFGAIALLLCAAIYLKSSGEMSAIFIGSAYIVYGISQAVRVRGKSSLSVAVVGAIVLALGIVTASFVIGGATLDKIIGSIMKCITGILILIMVVVQPMVNYSKHYAIGKSERWLVNIAYKLMPLVIIGGTALTLLQSFFKFLGYSFNFYIITIIGCTIWFVVTAYIIYLMLTHEYDDTIDKAEEAIMEYIDKSRNGFTQESSTNNNYRQISEDKVKSIVKKIAESWSQKSDVSFLLSGGGSIRFNVTFEIIGATINYTINGKLSGVRKEQLSEAYTFLGGKIDKAGYKIVEETEKELSKYNLPNSAYNINVKKGKIE